MTTEVIEAPASTEASKKATKGVSKPAEAAPEATTPEPTAPRVFAFEWDDNEPVPTDIPKATRSTELPFLAMFDAKEKPAFDGEKPHLFVPLAYFIERANKPEAVTHAYAKDKVRGQFKKWQKAKGSRDTLFLLAIDRKGTEGEKFAEPGVSFWMARK